MAFDNLTLEHSSTVDRIADELRRALFDGELDAGTPLREVALAEALGVARSTVREALGVLVGEGLATREPNRGVHVADIDPASLRDVCQARTVLETAGVRRWPDASEEARQAVRKALTALAEAAPDDFTVRHLDFHLTLVALTGSERLVATAEAMYAEVRLALAQVDRLRRNYVDQIAAHRLLVRLLEQGRIDETVAELEQHIAHGAESMLEAVQARTR